MAREKKPEYLDVVATREGQYERRLIQPGTPFKVEKELFSKRWMRLVDGTAIEAIEAAKVVATQTLHGNSSLTVGDRTATGTKDVPTIVESAAAAEARETVSQVGPEDEGKAQETEDEKTEESETLGDELEEQRRAEASTETTETVVETTDRAPQVSTRRRRRS